MFKGLTVLSLVLCLTVAAVWIMREACSDLRSIRLGERATFSSDPDGIRVE